jgi:hypothetical protein
MPNAWKNCGFKKQKHLGDRPKKISGIICKIVTSFLTSSTSLSIISSQQNEIKKVGNNQLRFIWGSFDDGIE